MGEGFVIATGTSFPLDPSSIISNPPSDSAATIGNPAAIASTIAKPKGSERAAETNKLRDESVAGMSSRQPGSVTISLRPSSDTRLSNDFRWTISGDLSSPMTTNCTSLRRRHKRGRAHENIVTFDRRKVAHCSDYDASVAIARPVGDLSAFETIDVNSIMDHLDLCRVDDAVLSQNFRYRLRDRDHAAGTPQQELINIS